MIPHRRAIARRLVDTALEALSPSRPLSSEAESDSWTVDESRGFPWDPGLAARYQSSPGGAWTFALHVGVFEMAPVVSEIHSLLDVEGEEQAQERDAALVRLSATPDGQVFGDVSVSLVPWVVGALIHGSGVPPIDFARVEASLKERVREYLGFRGVHQEMLEDGQEPQPLTIEDCEAILTIIEEEAGWLPRGGIKAAAHVTGLRRGDGLAAPEQDAASGPPRAPISPVHGAAENQLPRVSQLPASLQADVSEAEAEVAMAAIAQLEAETAEQKVTVWLAYARKLAAAAQDVEAASARCESLQAQLAAAEADEAAARDEVSRRDVAKAEADAAVAATKNAAHEIAHLEPGWFARVLKTRRYRHWRQRGLEAAEAAQASVRAQGEAATAVPVAAQALEEAAATVADLRHETEKAGGAVEMYKTRLAALARAPQAAVELAAALVAEGVTAERMARLGQEVGRLSDLVARAQAASSAKAHARCDAEDRLAGLHAALIESEAAPAATGAPNALGDPPAASLST